jgi:hypothetical protein
MCFDIKCGEFSYHITENINICGQSNYISNDWDFHALLFILQKDRKKKLYANNLVILKIQI